MSEENIPQKVDPFRFADNALQLKGVLSVEKMSRLCESLHQKRGDVKVNIEFGRDEQEIPFLKGEISSVLTLQCQRCMEPLPYEIIHKMLLGIAHTDEEAETLPKGYDPIVAKDDILVIPEMVEDELIISLPAFPMHDPKECKRTLPLIIESEQAAPVEKENPFKVIEFLRKKQDPK